MRRFLSVGSYRSYILIGDPANCKIGLATYLLIWPDDGIMRKEDIRGIYDGSIFYKKADKRRFKKMQTHQQSRTSPTLVNKVQKLL